MLARHQRLLGNYLLFKADYGFLVIVCFALVSILFAYAVLFASGA